MRILPIIRRTLAVLLLACSQPIFAEVIALNADHPQQYVVVKGDTLWDIAGTFLQNPWQWPDIWQVNAQIETPDLIYPGDVVFLTIGADGQPILSLKRGLRTYKMSPGIREVVVDKPIPTIPLAAILPFLQRPRIMETGEIDDLPYVVSGSDERLISGSGDIVYVRGIDEENDADMYGVFHQGDVFHDPDTNEVLGFEARYVGDGKIVAHGDPATLSLSHAKSEVLIGARLMPIRDDDYKMNFFPHTPVEDIKGQIIFVLDGVSQIGQYQSAVINRGTRDGLEIGHVLGVYQAGETIFDQVTEERRDQVTLPDEFAGEALVYKTTEKVSLILIMKAYRALHLKDKVRSIDRVTAEGRRDASR